MSALAVLDKPTTVPEMSGSAGEQDGTALGILSWRVGELESTVKTGLADVKGQIDRLSMVPMTQYNAEKRESDRRLDKIEENLRYVVRSFVAFAAAVVVAGVSTVLAMVT
jgi:hypothetical protein